MDISAMCEKLVKARGSKTQKATADDLGISQSALNMYESGERIPRDEVKERIAEYYGMTVGFLFFNEEVHRM